MTELHLPWLELTILVPLVGALLVMRIRDTEVAHKWCAAITAITFGCTLGAWYDFISTGASIVHDPFDVVQKLLGHEFLILDELSAPLVPLAALLYFLTAVVTLRTKAKRFSFAAALVAEAITLATLSCQTPWGVIVLLIVGTLPPLYELGQRKKPTRVFALHMGLFSVLLVVGHWLVESTGDSISGQSWWALLPLLVAVLIRSGVAPLHCWMTDLFEHATFGTALLFVTPMLGAYAAVRLLFPIAPDWVLNSMGMLALATAVYAAGMALVQRDARRFFCYIFLSHSALVLVGLDTVSPLGLTGGLCVWLSVGLSLAGFGLTLRSLEARHGRLSLLTFHGVYDHTPLLAICFLLTGLASIGFPGTFGFLGTELLVDGAVSTYPYVVGVVVVIAAALNGIAVLQAYFRLFTGTRHATTVPLRIGMREWIAALTLSVLILGGGAFPQAGIESRHHAAERLLEQRHATPKLAQHQLP